MTTLISSTLQEKAFWKADARAIQRQPQCFVVLPEHQDKPSRQAIVTDGTQAVAEEKGVLKDAQCKENNLPVKIKLLEWVYKFLDSCPKLIPA